MKRVLVLLTAVASALPSVGCATSPSSRSVEALFESANAVVVGKVTKVAASCDQLGGVCNRLYMVSLDEASIKELKSKSGMDANYSSMCSNVPLEIGSTYILLVEATTKFNTAGSDKCLHAIDFDGVFEKIGSYVYRVGAPDAKIILDFEGDKYLTNAVVEPDFEKAMDSFAKRAAP